MSSSQHSMHHQAGVVKLVSNALVQDMLGVGTGVGVQRLARAVKPGSHAEPSCRNQRIRSLSKRST